jgi:hypothetical protein
MQHFLLFFLLRNSLSMVPSSHRTVLFFFFFSVIATTVQLDGCSSTTTVEPTDDTVLGLICVIIYRRTISSCPMVPLEVLASRGGQKALTCLLPPLAFAHLKQKRPFSPFLTTFSCQIFVCISSLLSEAQGMKRTIDLVYV